MGREVLDGPFAHMARLFPEVARRSVRFQSQVALQPMDNDSWNSVFAALRNKSAAVSFNPSYYRKGPTSVAHFTLPVIRNRFCLVVRRAPPLAFGAVLFYPLRARVWAALGGALLATAAAWHAAHRPAPRHAQRPAHDRALRRARVMFRTPDISAAHEPGPGRALFDVAEVALTGASSRRVPRSAQRLLLVGLLLLALVVGNAYSGQLLGFLAAPPRLPDANTFEEVAAAVRTVFTFKVTEQFLRVPGGRKAFNELRNKMKIMQLDSSQGNLMYIVDKGDAAQQMPEIDLKVFRFMPNFMRDGQAMLHQAAECVLSPGHMGFLVARDSPIYDLVNAFVLRCVEAGLPAQWLRAQRRRMVAAGVLVGGEEKGRPRELRVAQLAGPLLCLGAGLGVAALAWAAETLWRRRGCCRTAAPCPALR
ncbi:hypothetical protein R5R35_004195 [Gryllus longicercus]|uniref:Ionotropic receptor n=1 Tax=Gryllus longicercus TaxID=2509291 RepID=A0AAN9VCZ4_9ORTH